MPFDGGKDWREEPEPEQEPKLPEVKTAAKSLALLWVLWMPLLLWYEVVWVKQ